MKVLILMFVFFACTSKDKAPAEGPAKGQVDNRGATTQAESKKSGLKKSKDKGSEGSATSPDRPKENCKYSIEGACRPVGLSPEKI